MPPQFGAVETILSVRHSPFRARDGRSMRPMPADETPPVRARSRSPQARFLLACHQCLELAEAEAEYFLMASASPGCATPGHRQPSAGYTECVARGEHHRRAPVLDRRQQPRQHARAQRPAALIVGRQKAVQIPGRSSRARTPATSSPVRACVATKRPSAAPSVLLLVRNDRRDRDADGWRNRAVTMNSRRCRRRSLPRRRPAEDRWASRAAVRSWRASAPPSGPAGWWRGGGCAVQRASASGSGKDMRTSGLVRASIGMAGASGLGGSRTNAVMVKNARRGPVARHGRIFTTDP